MGIKFYPIVALFLLTISCTEKTFIEEGLVRDSVELTEEYKNVKDQVHEEVEQILEGTFRGRSVYYKRFLKEKKRILKEKHDIEWKTPFELNPGLVSS